MRKVTEVVTKAFISGKPKRMGNTESSGNSLFLHGNEIARFNPKSGKLEIRTCGWQSNVTKDRLNGLPGVYIQQIKHVWHLNGKAWVNSENWTEV